jgi:GNAT superfamily N-acetyltransferase
LIKLTSYRPEHRGALITFWNAAYAGRRNFRVLTAGEWEARVVGSTVFDPQGLILATTAGGQVVGGVHALRPAPREGIYLLYHERHHVAWLMVGKPWRGQGIGSRLLQAAESWLYYCPVHFATETTPLYGSVEGPWLPLFGSSQRMGVSLREDRGLIEWLARRGYRIVDAGDVSLARDLDQGEQAPQEPLWDALGLRPVVVSEMHPWTGPGYDELRLWDSGQGWPYAGTVLVDAAGTAVGRIVWTAVPAPSTAGAAIIRLDVAESWRGQGLGAYLLDRALHEMAQQGFRRVEVQTHLQRHPVAYELYQRRRFVPEEAWANLVKQ